MKISSYYVLVYMTRDGQGGTGTGFAISYPFP